MAPLLIQRKDPGENTPSSLPGSTPRDAWAELPAQGIECE